MNRLSYLATLCLAFAGFFSVQASEILNFNNEWKFQLCENGVVNDWSAPSLDDSSWRTLNVPHDWSIEGRYDKSNPSGPQGGYMPCGTAWYRKHFTLDDKYEGKRVTLRFDGVYMNSETWINGRMVGRYPNGYNSFEYDITPYVKTDGSENVIAVKVDNSLQPASRWYSGSGIYRDVHLVIDNQIHFVHDATFARTLSASTEKAVLGIDCRVIANAYPETRFAWTDNTSLFIWTRNDETTDTQPAQPNNRVKKQCEVRFSLMDGERLITSVSEPRVIGDFTTSDFSLEMPVDNPKLWSSSSPSLYTLVCELLCEGKVMDRNEMKVGLREIKFSNTAGMTVNGVPEKIQGVCMHQSAGCFGTAVPREVWEYRLRELKKMGCNAVRLSHYPHAPYIYELCDEIGLYATNEIFDEWNRGQEWGYSETSYGKMPYTYHLYFDQWHDTDLRRLIRRDRNHPCLIMYMLGNEIPNQRIQGNELLKELRDISHQEDPTRPVTAGCDFFVGANAYGFMDIMDIAGYNYIDRIHPDSLYLAEHEKHPERIILGTETYHTYKNHASIEKCPAAIGEFIWVAFDYLGEVVWPDTRGWDDGIFDVAGFPKSEAFLRKCLWTQEPAVYAGVLVDDERDFDWSIRPVKCHWNWEEGNLLTVYAYSNCQEVELKAGGKKYGRQKVDRDSCSAMWQVPYKAGELKVVGYNGGKKVAEWSVSTTDEQPSEIKSTCLNPDSEGEVKIYEIDAVDSKGHRIPTFSGSFVVSAENATILGIDNGNQYDPEGKKYTSLSEGNFYEGRALVYLKVHSQDSSHNLPTLHVEER